jgi:hypothetical protein
LSEQGLTGRAAGKQRTGVNSLWWKMENVNKDEIFIPRRFWEELSIYDIGEMLANDGCLTAPQCQKPQPVDCTSSATIAADTAIAPAGGAWSGPKDGQHRLTIALSAARLALPWATKIGR